VGQRYESYQTQTTRNIDGTIFFGYVSATLDHDPLPEEITWLLTANTPPTGQVNLMHYVPNAGTSKNAVGGWAVCPICALSFPKSEMTRVKGQWYCNQNKCAEEAQLA